MMIPLYRLWLHGFYGLYRPRCPLSRCPLLNFITHSPTGILRRTHGKNGPKFGMQVYHDHIQNWFDFGLILALCWAKTLMKLWFLALHGRNGMKFGMQVYNDHLQNWWTFGHGLMVFLLLVLFWLSEMDQIRGSRNFLENAWKGWPEKGEHRHIFYSLHWVLSSLLLALGQSAGIVPSLMPCWLGFSHETMVC